jgi:uncharacterized protein DUF1573
MRARRSMLLLAALLGAAGCKREGSAKPVEKAETAKSPVPPPKGFPSRPASAIVFPETGKELGTIDWPGGAEATFRFEHRGDQPVAIRDVGSTCGCMVGRLRIVQGEKTVRESREPGQGKGTLLTVSPGETGELRVRFETRTFTSEVREKASVITLWTDEKGAEPPRVFVRAQIARAYEVVPAQVAFDPMGAKQTASKQAQVLVVERDAKPPFDARIASAPEGLKAEVEEIVQGTRQGLIVSLLAGPGLPRTGVAGDVVIEARIGKPLTIRIPVHVPVVPDVHAKPSQLDFLIVEPDRRVETVPVTLALLDPDRRFRLGTPVIEGEASDRLELRIDPVEEGAKYTLRLIAQTGLPAAGTSGIHGLVRLATGLEDFPELRLPYRAYTRDPIPRPPASQPSGERASQPNGEPLSKPRSGG